MISSIQDAFKCQPSQQKTPQQTKYNTKYVTSKLVHGNICVEKPLQILVIK